MNIKELIKSRYSVRSFTNEAIDIETIKEILEISSCAPSGGNIQPWKIYVVTNNAKEKLVEKALANYDNGVQEKIEYVLELVKNESRVPKQFFKFLDGKTRIFI